MDIVARSEEQQHWRDRILANMFCGIILDNGIGVHL